MAGPCEESYGGCTNFFKTRFGFAWKRGAPLGLAYLPQEYVVFPSWSPGVWNSVCVSASASLGLFSVNINDGEIRFRTEQYDGYHIQNDGNVLLMGLPEFRDHTHGAMTDVDVFSRILSE